MREVTKTIQVYQFNELPDDIKIQVLTAHHDWNVCYNWWQIIYEDAEMVGIDIHEFDIEQTNYCRLDFKKSHYDVAQLIMSNHGEQCETYELAYNFTKELERLTNDKTIEDGTLDDLINDLENDFEKAIGKCYVKMLRDEYNHLISDECLIEQFNEMEFTEDGAFYYD